VRLIVRSSALLSQQLRRGDSHFWNKLSPILADNGSTASASCARGPTWPSMHWHERFSLSTRPDARKGMDLELIEIHLSKLDIAGWNPVSRSNTPFSIYTLVQITSLAFWCCDSV
jgi:hypothetical protein